MKITKIKLGNTLFLILLSLLLVSYNKFGNNTLDNIFSLRPNISNEIIYIHTDRSNYYPGDTLWFKAYNLESKTLKTSYKSNILNIVLYSLAGEKISAQKHKLLGGKASGYVALSDTLISGEYILVAYSNLTDGKSFDEIFSKKINLVKANEQDAFIRISFPNKVYSTGDNIEGNIEIRNKQGSRYANTKVLLQLSQSDQIKHEIEINTGNKGIENFAFIIPENLSKKALFLNARIINSVLNENISISIPLKQTPPSIQFFPESGVAIENAENIIAFKAIDVNGNPFDFMAVIVDKEDRVIKNISSRYMGMGKFNLKYAAKDSLYCKIAKPEGYQTKYHLPIPEKNTCSFSINNKYKNRLIIKLNTDKSVKDSIFKMFLFVKNKVYLNKTVNINSTDSISIDTHRFPKGVAQIDLCNANGQPLAERIVFINLSSKPSHKISGLKEQYHPKGKVHFLMNLKDKQLVDDPVNISLSVSLIGQKDFPESEKNILSALLLEKALIGNIPNPGFYFTNHPLADEALDLLMLTHGWRKIIRPDSNKVTTWKLKDQESDKVIEGRVVKHNGKPVKLAEVTLVNLKSFGVSTTLTDKNGRFTFSAIDYMMVADTNVLTLTATGSNNNQKVKILLDYPFHNKISNEINQHSQKDELINRFHQNKDQTLINVWQDSVIPKVNNSYYTINKNDVKIKVVDVKAKRISVIPKEIFEKEFMVYELKGKDVKVVSGSNSEAIFHMLQKAAGHLKVEDGGKILFRGNNSINFSNQQGAAIVVDGMFKGYDWRVLEFIAARDIESIKITKSAAAAMRYTSFAMGGLIEVTTIKGFTDEELQIPTKRAMNITYIPGFQVKREYYSPAYSQKEKPGTLDLRKTIFWKPDIKPDKSGMAEIKFYTSDMPGEYLLKFEGVSKRGRIFYLVKNFKVN